MHLNNLIDKLIKNQVLFFIVFVCSVRWQCTDCARWAHTALLGGPDYRLLWSLGPGPHEITFEVQVKTHGYVGFGLSRDGNMPGSDFVVGWVENGQVYFQVSDTLSLDFTITVGLWILLRR